MNFRTFAMNGVGYGAYSTVYPLKADSVPLIMNKPTCNSAINLTPNWIYLKWLGIAGDLKTGGDLPIYYGLEWD